MKFDHACHLRIDKPDGKHTIFTPLDRICQLNCGPGPVLDFKNSANHFHLEAEILMEESIKRVMKRFLHGKPHDCLSGSTPQQSSYWWRNLFMGFALADP